MLPAMGRSWVLAVGMVAVLAPPALAQTAAPAPASPAAEATPGPAPWIGVGLRGTGGTPGVELFSVYPDTPAAEAGLVAGDQILSVDGAPVRSTEELIGTVRRYVSGQKVELLLLRDGARRRVSVTLAQKPTHTELAESLLLGKPAPPLALEPTAGLPPSIADLRGNVVVAVLTSGMCHACDYAVRALDKLRRHRGHRDLRVVGIALDPASIVGSIGRRIGVGMPFYAGLDRGGASDLAWSDVTMPQVLVIDRGGIVRYVATIDDGPAPADLPREARLIVDRASLVIDRVLGRRSRRATY